MKSVLRPPVQLSKIPYLERLGCEQALFEIEAQPRPFFAAAEKARQ